MSSGSGLSDAGAALPQPGPRDATHFRHCLGGFATGVTVVTTRSADGRAVGLTANSFNSLSLSPPLVLWSLARRSSAREAFRTAEYFAVSVLRAEQCGVAQRFASRHADRFAGVATRDGVGGVPVLEGVLAWFECRTRSVQEQGDHLLFVGEVLACGASEGTPLVFAQGVFARTAALESAGG